MEDSVDNENADMSAQLAEARRAMRRKVLSINDKELTDLYYRAVTLSEHEAARRKRSEMVDEASYADLAASGGIVGAP